MWPPSDWDGSLAARSARPPRAGLALEHVYGYAGKECTAPNVWYTADMRLVYYVAAVGVVYDPATHSQQFFQVCRLTAGWLPPCGHGRQL